MKALIPLALTALLAGCASTPDVSVDHDPSADFTRFHTYYWAQEMQITNPLAKQRIIAGIDARMAARGFTRQEGSGDIALVGNVATSQKQTLDTFYTGTGMGGWGWGPGWGYGGMASSTTRVNTYTVGTLVLDMFDTSTKKAVWRGVASGTVSDSPQKNENAVNAALDKMFVQFPPGAVAK
jgi:hypothetical protein